MDTQVKKTSYSNNTVTIQLYEYRPSGSTQPLLYFDTSRRKPSQVVTDFPHNAFPPSTVASNVPGHEMFYKPSNGNGCIVPLKQELSDAPEPLTLLTQVEYVNQRTFQILHCGVDDLWGDNCVKKDPDTGVIVRLAQLNGPGVPHLRFPTGPFLGDVADTVSNFYTGNLADEQE